jgi:hypothetical protein
MHPLDLVKVRFQLAETPRPQPTPSLATPLASSSSAPSLGASSSSSLQAGQTAQAGSSSVTRLKPRIGTGVYRALQEAVVADGWSGLYRGLMPNLVGGASSVDVSNGDIAKCVSREDRPCQGLTCLLDHGDRLVLEEMISSTELIPDTI